jgi:glycosyltransferase involved in cell wall biosynthesis
MRVAFTLIADKRWTGGSHYLRNLLGVLHEFSENVVHPILFAGLDAPEQEVNSLRPYLTGVVQDKCFTKWNPAWVIRQTLRRVHDRDKIAEKLFRNNKIDVVFHSGLFGTRFALPCVNWIADFQHLHMPEMFSWRERKLRDKNFRALALMSKRLVFSSESAKKDFESFMPDYQGRVDVMRFVVRVPEDVYDGRPLDKLRQYDVPEKFFHLPNQFWKHKNHLVVIRALKLLKELKSEIFVVCTGNISDYRDPGYFNFLKKEIYTSGIGEQIAFLGLVPLDHLYAFMRQSVAILNPSFFEGWSTTVEEAKSLGKKVLLSDIAVHHEQDPTEGTYFNPTNPDDLAEKMLKVWEETQAGPDFQMETKARLLLQTKVRSFAETFVNIMKKAISECNKK